MFRRFKVEMLPVAFVVLDIAVHVRTGDGHRITRPAANCDIEVWQRSARAVAFVRKQAVEKKIARIRKE